MPPPTSCALEIQPRTLCRYAIIYWLPLIIYSILDAENRLAENHAEVAAHPNPTPRGAAVRHPLRAGGGRDPGQCLPLQEDG